MTVGLSSDQTDEILSTVVICEDDCTNAVIAGIVAILTKHAIWGEHVGLKGLWQKSPEQLEGKRLSQIIAFAGEGKLRDHSETSEEFRAFLSVVPSSMLEGFVDECLNEPFPESGFALQDVVNEIGRRLGFNVTRGSYQGRQGLIGFDGIWIFPTKHSVVVEVKSSDAYRVDTARIAGYRKQLIAQSLIQEDSSSILLLVGRQDTGDLEAQIRGSRYAWEIRVISIDALLRLMKLKETLDDPNTITRICEVLIPREYTRLDEIVDLVFSATETLLANLIGKAETPRFLAFSTWCAYKMYSPTRSHSAKHKSALALHKIRQQYLRLEQNTGHPTYAYRHLRIGSP